MKLPTSITPQLVNLLAFAPLAAADPTAFLTARLITLAARARTGSQR